MAASQLRCWLIGGTPLLQECAEILLARGHEVAGAVTASRAIEDWARSRGLRIVDARGDYAAALEERPFDCLLSIAHMALVPQRVLRLPRRAALNFHDGPLPDFAGLHAPAWALIEGATRYGVCWHQLEPRVDAGAIVARRTLEIAPGESSHSLNVKCFEAALDSFGPLVDDLAAGRLQPQPQELGRRRYFGRQARPPAAAVLDWTRPAAELEALVRALDFGRHPNPLGLPKLQHGGRLVGVTGARVAAGEDPAAPAVAPAPAPAPGSVLALDATGLRVATARGALVLTDFVDLSGRPLSSDDAAARLAIAPGAVLETLDAERARRLGELDRRMSQVEEAWVERLSALEPAALTFPGAGAPGSDRVATAAIELPPRLRELFPAQPLSAVVGAALAIYLSRLGRRPVLDLGWRGPALRAETDGLEAWASSRVPLRVEVRLDEPLAPLVERVTAALEEADRLGPWPRDLVARQPALRAPGAGLGADGELPVALEVVERFGSPTLPRGAEWTVELEPTGACRGLHRLAPAHAESLHRGFLALLESLAARPQLPVSAHPLASPEDRERQLGAWNRTARPYRRDALVHALVEEQARRTPDATALSFEGRSLGYAELVARARALAAALRAQGAGPGRRVGLHLDRSLDLPVAILAVLQSGAAYVPLEPALPSAALAFLIEDAQLDLVVTHSAHEAALPPGVARRLVLDAAAAAAAVDARDDGSAGAPAGTLDGREPRPEDPAYVLYTSGSTGRPKGVVVAHRNLVAFLAAMDAIVPHDPPGTWLAVTSPSFDISLLELLWPLTHGFEVVLAAAPVARRRAPPSARRLDFSLFYFANDEGAARGDGYRLLLEGARFADAHGWRAVWTPERHFHAFGGLYPNPAVAGAALAAVTRRVEIRAGSVVLPLHHPIRIAEEWALVDNLSGGRVGISFASGWHPDDFVLATRTRAESRASFARDLDRVRRLWRGETLDFTGPDGRDAAIRTRPRPVQPELPVWITAAGNIDTFIEAGRLGAHVLTHLLGQSEPELEAKIAAYREARAGAGLDPATGIVTLALHAFLGDDEAAVRERARGALLRYLDSSLAMTDGHAAAFPAFRGPPGAGAAGDELSSLEARDRRALLEHAAERYLTTAGLIGTPAGALERTSSLRARGVDEIACLVDFGLPADEVLAALPALDGLRRRAQPPRERPAAGGSIAELIEHEGVTHLQCTPSLARLLCADPASRAALSRLRHLFVGGEACPAALARELSSATAASIANMYGPTETTVWSSTHTIATADVDESRPDLPRPLVPIGRPIANTRLYVVDEALEPLPVGAAGELVIGGDGVAAGYLRRPGLEAERFVPDRFANEPGARLYRTGDLVRYREDGVLEFLGRTDHQIKVRGRRIEPAEIEAALERQPGVAEAVVVAREDGPDDQRLVAYIAAGATPPGASPPDAAALRAALAAQLPEELVPARFVVLPRLPRTPNGKLDRRALPPPPAAEPVNGAQARPEGEMETRLARLWQEVLGLEQVGVTSNFFDLGGHSLLVVRILRRLGELSSKRVSLTDLFRYPTVRALARFLVAGDEPDDLDAAALERGRRRRRWMQQSRRGAGGS